MQVHGGIGYSRLCRSSNLPPSPPLPHPEGSEEVQMRRVAQTCSACAGSARALAMRARRPSPGIDFDTTGWTSISAARSAAHARHEVQRTQGGMSNPTYFVRRGDWRAVLPKQPKRVADAVCSRHRS